MRRTMAGGGKRGVVAALLLACAGGAHAQTCTTQAKMMPELRNGLAGATLSLAQAVKAGDTAKIQAATIPVYASNFASTAFLIHHLADKLAQDTLQVTQIYALDASGRLPAETGDAEFSCALSGTTAETDFSIPSLPPGKYGFAMVEATGAKPWLLAFLLRQDSGVWKMAGFYPRARTAAGHDGGWYWKAAWDDAQAGKPWLAWLLYGEADQLLRPANFATSTKLDSLRAEQRTAVPPELVKGIGPDTPLTVKSADTTEFQFTGIETAGTDDGERLNLVLHVKQVAGGIASPQAAAKAFVDAHPELRPSFDGVVVLAGQQESSSSDVQLKMSDIP